MMWQIKWVALKDVCSGEWHYVAVPRGIGTGWACEHGFFTSSPTTQTGLGRMVAYHRQYMRNREV